MRFARITMVALAVGCALGRAGPAAAVELVGDDFSYADGNIDGTQNGGSNWNATNAWTSAWTYSGDFDAGEGLAGWGIRSGQAQTLKDTGKDLNNGVASRSFTTDSAGGTTLYVGFDLSVDDDNESDWATHVQLLGGALQMGVEDDNLHFVAGSDEKTPAGFSEGDAARLIARIVFDDAGNEAVTVWRDAASEADAALTTLSGELGALDLGSQVDLVRTTQDQNIVNVDNLQIGTDFFFIPEPGSVSLLGLAGAAAALRRRR
jgi:hypothetical protein